MAKPKIGQNMTNNHKSDNIPIKSCAIESIDSTFDLRVPRLRLQAVGPIQNNQKKF